MQLFVAKTIFRTALLLTTLQAAFSAAVMAQTVAVTAPIPTTTAQSEVFVAAGTFHGEIEGPAVDADGNIYAVNFGGGQVDITNGKFVFSASEAYMIENGKLSYPVKGATLIGNGPEVLNHVSMIGNDLRLDSGIGVCGKEGQSLPVGVGQPSLRIDGLTVGGTA